MSSKAPNLRVRISASEGRILGDQVGLGNDRTAGDGRNRLGRLPLRGRCDQNNSPTAASNSTKKYVDKTGQHRGTLVERFLPKKDSVRWELEVRGKGEPWSTPIETSLTWPEPEKSLLLDGLGRSPSQRDRLDESPAPGQWDRPRVPLRRT